MACRESDMILRAFLMSFLKNVKWPLANTLYHIAMCEAAIQDDLTGNSSKKE